MENRNNPQTPKPANSMRLLRGKKPIVTMGASGRTKPSARSRMRLVRASRTSASPPGCLGRTAMVLLAPRASRSAALTVRDHCSTRARRHSKPACPLRPVTPPCSRPSRRARPAPGPSGRADPAIGTGAPARRRGSVDPVPPTERRALSSGSSEQIHAFALRSSITSPPHSKKRETSRRQDQRETRAYLVESWRALPSDADPKIPAAPRLTCDDAVPHRPSASFYNR